MQRDRQKGGTTPKRPRASAPQTLELTVDGLAADGSGSATLDGRHFVVRGLFPGERALVRVVHRGQRISVAEPVRLLAPSPQRIAPPCTHAAECEACPFIALEYGAQQELKRQLLRQAFSHHALLRQLEIPPVLAPARTLHYRNSAKLVVAGQSASPLIGIYRPHSHDVLDIGDCSLHHPLINRIAAALRDGIRRLKVPIFSPRTGNGILRYLGIRVSEAQDRALVVLVTAYRSYNEMHHLCRYLAEQVPEVAVMVQNVNASSGNAVFGDKDHFVTRNRSIGDTIGDVRFTISPRSFFQVNNGGAELIYTTVRSWAALDGSQEVADVYCGVGGISLYLAPQARRVTGIEYAEPAVADAQVNARLNNIQNCEFMAGDAAELLGQCRADGRHFQLLVLNPPRKGCDGRVLTEVARLAPPRIIYVSCSPDSLARDLVQLSRDGYQVRRLQPVDMFPQTPHVETVVLLERRSS